LAPSFLLVVVLFLFGLYFIYLLWLLAFAVTAAFFLYAGVGTHSSSTLGIYTTWKTLNLIIARFNTYVKHVIIAKHQKFGIFGSGQYEFC
jgi:hypothetical protein